MRSEEEQEESQHYISSPDLAPYLPSLSLLLYQSALLLPSESVDERCKLSITGAIPQSYL